MALNRRKFLKFMAWLPALPILGKLSIDNTPKYLTAKHDIILSDEAQQGQIFFISSDKLFIGSSDEFIKYDGSIFEVKANVS